MNFIHVNWLLNHTTTTNRKEPLGTLEVFRPISVCLPSFKTSESTWTRRQSSPTLASDSRIFTDESFFVRIFNSQTSVSFEGCPMSLEGIDHDQTGASSLAEVK